MNQEKQPSPELFLNAVMAYRDSAAVKGAVELDVFTAIAQGMNTAEDPGRALPGRSHAACASCVIISASWGCWRNPVRPMS